MVNISLGPTIVPSKLANLPFSIVPWRLISVPATSVFTAASPLTFKELGSILKEESVLISAVTFPSTGPKLKAP